MVRGIGGYGNCVGVPTVGGEINFHAAYDGNPLVNAMTVGIAPTRTASSSRAAAGIGNPVVYVGSKTGRDGIHGATMASAEFGADSEEKRPTVQVGDPFTEKLLIEACLELMATDAIVAIQDMGAAGLTSSSVEMAGKGGVGIELDLDEVPQRETGMTAYEMMLSESQERMLMVLRPDREDVARAIFEKWELDFAVIGHLTDTGRIVVRHQRRRRGRHPARPAGRPGAALPPPDRRDRRSRAPLGAVADPVGLDDGAARTLIGCPDLCSRAWVWDQYDSTVGGQTVKRPGAADAAVVRIEGHNRALALTTDCTPRYCAADPEAGGAQAVAEAWRNLTAIGARPLAITDNMNFGNPEKPEIMGQFAAAIRGMAAACRALDFPVVSRQCQPLQRDRRPRASCRPPRSAASACWTMRPRRSASRCAPGAGPGADRRDRGLARPVALAARNRRPRGRAAAAGRSRGRARATAISSARRSWPATSRACHDVSDGGLLVALCRNGDGRRHRRAAARRQPRDIPPHAFWFGEDQARYILARARRHRPAGRGAGRRRARHAVSAAPARRI